MLCIFQSLLKTADQLKIKGLCESPEEKEDTQPAALPYLSRGYSKIRRVVSPKHSKPLDCNRKFNKFKRDKQENINLSEDEEDVENNKDSLVLDTSSDEENDMPVTANEERRRKVTQTQTKPLNMSNHGIIAGQVFASWCK